MSGGFTWLDWATVVTYLMVTTWVGHCLRGRQATVRDFFLAGRAMPWPAVTGSIIATSLSAVTFVGVPSLVFVAQGDLTYLQLAVGSILGRVAVAVWLIPAFYEKEIFSPYDFIEHRLGPLAGRATCGLFFMGSVLGQGARVLLTALVLQVVVPGLSLEWSIAVIGLFAILWTWMGGMATVIWTDVVQFFVFVFGGLVVAGWILTQLNLSDPEIWRPLAEENKWRLLNWSTDPLVEFTVWTALLAVPFQNFAAYGMDQLNAQRIFCCRNQTEARKALLWSCASELITVLMLVVGLLLVVFYAGAPDRAVEAAQALDRGEKILPFFIVHELPPVITGLVIAAIFAAAISSLDSILAALSQTSMTMFYQPLLAPGRTQAHYLWVSRGLVVFWAVVLCAGAVVMGQYHANLLSLALAFTSFTYGPLLVVFLVSFTCWRPSGWLWVGAVLGGLLAVFLCSGSPWLESFPGGLAAYPRVAWPWFCPLGALVTALILAVGSAVLSKFRTF